MLRDGGKQNEMQKADLYREALQANSLEEDLNHREGTDGHLLSGELSEWWSDIQIK